MTSFARRLLVAIIVLGSTIAASPATSASIDGNVEWEGISHLPIFDRLPVVPLGGEAFAVRLRTWQGDAQAVRAVHDQSAVIVNGAVVEQIGPYDIWEMIIPASSASARVQYYFEVQDGADVDFYSLDGMSDLAPALPGSWFVVDFVTLEHAPRGATPHPSGGVVFRVWAPTPTGAHVRGSFNAWGLTNPLTVFGDDFIGYVPGASINDRYKFYFSNGTWAIDVYGRSLDGGDNYNAIVQDPTLFGWTDQNYSPPSLEEMVIYQLHVGTFAGRNDPLGTPSFPSGYADVLARADHLSELGVNAVMLNPIGEFPGDRSAGYNPVSQFAPERIYGAPNDFKRLVDGLHARGIAVLLDIVWNHQSISDNGYWNYDGGQIYFDTPPTDTPWGAQLDFDRPEIRDHLIQSAHAWFDEYHLDGFRMDATDFMNIGAQEAAGWLLMQRLNDEVDNRWADRVIIAEQLPDDTWVTRPTATGGAGFDAQYFDAFTDRLREELGDAAFGDPEMWKIRDVINGFGTELSSTRVVNYLELHDEAWPTSGGQRMVVTIDPSAPHDDQFARGRTMLGQGIVLTAPGVPAMLMGTEWLEDTGFGTDEVNRIDWAKKTIYGGVYQYYRDLIALRTTRADLRSDAFWQVFHLNESGNVLGFRRGLGDGTLLIVANFSNTDYQGYRLGVPTNQDWRVRIDSNDVVYGGSGALNLATLSAETISSDGFGQSVLIELPAMSLFVIEHAPDPTGTPPLSEAGSQLRLLPTAPNPARGGAAIRYRLGERQDVRITLHDVRGRRVRILVDGMQSAGDHETFVNTRDLAHGTYFVRMRTPTATRSIKMVVAN